MSVTRKEVTEVNGNVINSEENLTNVAIGLHKQNGEWRVAKFIFDPVTKDVKFKESMPSGDGTMDSVIEKFKLVASREVLP